MKGLYVLLLVVAVFAARSASQGPTKTRSGPPPRRGRGGHPAVMSRPPPKSGAPPLKKGGGRAAEVEAEREGGAGRRAGRRGGGRRPSARPGGAPPVPPQHPPAVPPAQSPAQPPAAPAKPQRPCNIAPVCGSDGYTYMSECFLWAGARKDCDGFCPCQRKPAPAPQPQPRPVPPKPRYSHPKPRPRPPSCNCPVWGTRVCGVDGNTYDNDCQRRCNFTGLECKGPCPCTGGKRGLQHKESTRPNIKLGPPNKVNTKNIRKENFQLQNHPSKKSRTNKHFNRRVTPFNREKGQVTRRRNPENIESQTHIAFIPKANQETTLPDTNRKGIARFAQPLRDRNQQIHVKVSVPRSRSKPHLANNNQQLVQPKGKSGSMLSVTNTKKMKTATSKVSQSNARSNTGPSNANAQVIPNNSNNNKPLIHKAGIQDRAQSNSARNSQQTGYTSAYTGQRLNAGAPSTNRKRMNSNILAGDVQYRVQFNSDRNIHQKSPTRINTGQRLNAGDSSANEKMNPNIPSGDIIAIFDVTDFQGGPPPQRIAKRTQITGTEIGVSGTGRRDSITKTGSRFSIKQIKQRGPKNKIKSRDQSNNHANSADVRNLPTKTKSGARNKAIKGLPVNLNLSKPNSRGTVARKASKAPFDETTAGKTGSQRSRNQTDAKLNTYQRVVGRDQNARKRVKTTTLQQNTRKHDSREQNLVSKSVIIKHDKQRTGTGNTEHNQHRGKQQQGKKFMTTKQPTTKSGISAKERRVSPNKKSACICPGYIKQVCGEDGKTYKNACTMKCLGVHLACNTACPCAVTPPKPPRCEDSCPRYASPPVCSVDGITFDSDCHLICSRKTKACDGPCPCPTTPRPKVCEDYCPTAYTPVCSTDGNTYGNDCRRRCSGRRKACDHACPCPTPPAPKCEDLCPRSYRAVCGVDGQTYTSDCLRRCSGVPRDCEGPCPCRRQTTTPVPLPPPVSCESTCLQDYTPVCTKDGKTFKNDCLRKCSGKIKDCNRRCPCRKRPPKVSCEDRCLAFEYDPVCDVDGTTHINVCSMRCRHATWSCNGRCPCPPPTPTCEELCPHTYEPVCSTDGNSFNNDCLRNCSRSALACNGRCPCPPPTPTCEELCPQTYEPVCSTDGNSFNNDCLRNCSGKEKKCDGACPCRRKCEDYCPTKWNPVCGNDGNTYNNECFMGCRKVRKQCSGQCPCPTAPPPPQTCEDRCPVDYKPVCSAWNHEFQNDCLRHCSGEQRRCEGPCPCEREVQQQQVQTPSCKQQCSWQHWLSGYDWVCTREDNTKSSCEAMCDYVGLACNGACPCGLPPAGEPTVSPWTKPDPYFRCGCSPFDVDPVCPGESPSDTIWNGCMARCQKIEYKCSSECPC